jgi:hypothetical protein
MTMLMLFAFRTVSLEAGMMPWLLNLATRTLARSLQLPEPLVHETGAFVFARVQAVENSIGKALCPIRLLRRLRSWLR